MELHHSSPTRSVLLATILDFVGIANTTSTLKSGDSKPPSQVDSFFKLSLEEYLICICSTDLRGASN
jgi:hypothetical protein